ncbi:MAG: tetratricopeptide repeat protein, partial [Candidatus Latescibacteria bacterium]|nr:tetratricopeptide repeat protein [Candidatus Latescibacterota bacterium]
LFAGGVAEAAYQYETDYWENSYPQGVAWVASQPSSDKRRIRAHYEPIKKTLDPNVFEWISLAEGADYFLVITRYDRHKLIPGEVLHTVQADGAPLLYVIRPDTCYTSDPFFYQSPYKYAYFGEFYSGLGDVKRAKKTYEMAIEMRVDTLVTKRRMWDYYRALGGLYLHAGEVDNARNVAQQALRVVPQKEEAWYLLAQVLIESGDYGSAQEAIEEALVLHPHDETYMATYIHIGVAFQQKNENIKALTIYEWVLAKKPNRVDILVNAGIACFSLGQYANAIVFFEKAFVISPRDLEIYLGLAQSYANVGDIKKAVVICKKALSIDPEHDDFLLIKQQLEVLQNKK